MNLTSIIKTAFITSILSSAFLGLNVYAGDGPTRAEKRVLNKIASELIYLKELSERASNEASDKSRVRFDYNALISDLDAIRHAIEGHTKTPSRTPRKVRDLNKKYTK